MSKENGAKPETGGFNIQLQARTDLASGTGELCIVTTFCPYDASEQAIYDKVMKVKKVLARVVGHNNDAERARQEIERETEKACIERATSQANATTQ